MLRIVVNVMIELHLLNCLLAVDCGVANAVHVQLQLALKHYLDCFDVAEVVIDDENLASGARSQLQLRYVSA